MKVLITVTHEDTLNTEFTDCQGCAFAKAVRRVLDMKKVGLLTEGVDHCSIDGVTYPHKEFSGREFKNLQRKPGSFMVYEMYLPERLLNESWLKNAKKEEAKVESKVKSNT